jgi:hypothetical protein
VSVLLRQAVAMLARHQPELSEQGCLVEVKVLRRERISRQPIHRHPVELDNCLPTDTFGEDVSSLRLLSP